MEEDWKHREILFEEFLSSIPPVSRRLISNIAVKITYGKDFRLSINTPEIVLYCNNETCKGDRLFYYDMKHLPAIGKEWDNYFLLYICKNCEVTRKLYAISARISIDTSVFGEAIKIGEYPPYGPHTPSILFTLIGEDKDLYLKGRRSESQGLGIGAFSYYRRIIENQKNRLIDKIIEVGQITKVSSDLITKLKQAKTETQFSKAVDVIKDAIPPSLLIENENPL